MLFNLLDAEVAGGGQQYLQLLLLPILFVVMYFLMIRPQNKKRKKEEEMRNSMKIGDEIVTIGGIEGKIVNIKENSDSIIIETGADRNKLTIKKWSISSCNAESQENVAEAK